jgi:stage III sporulation protein AE
LRGLTALIKSSYTRTLGFVMLLLSFVLSTQTLLRAAADSLTARAAKFLAGNLIPVVGGALGDTFRTVASGVAFLKSTVGVGVMIVLFLMLLPVLISLLLTRLSFRLSLTVSDLLGCETESRLLNELVGIYGTLIAVVSMCTVFLIFALTLFVRVSAA